jgi:ubiquinone/menaquinone biosynthesis C-methylase UbiE
MSKGPLDYHRLELSIAANPDDARRILPAVSARHRRILDVGCGAGQTLIASNLEEGVLAVGADLDYLALAYGRQQATNINFVRAAGEALPFKNDSFDLVICRVALPYMHVERALREMFRVLDETGELWLVLHPLSMTATELFANLRQLNSKATIYRLWVLGNGLTLHLFGKQWRWPLHPKRYESWQSAARTRRMLLTAGFHEINVNRDNHFVISARKIERASGAASGLSSAM